MVRCGRCRTQFDVPGEGRFACPSCGSANQVGGSPADPGLMTQPPAPEPELPSPRVTCPDCEFGFIIGAVETAPCPMCGALVETGLSVDPAPEPESEGV